MADAYGWDTGLLEQIEDFRSYVSIAVPHYQGFCKALPVHKAPVITTKGWDVKFCWKDRSTNWIPLAEIKESNPIGFAKAAISFKHDSTPAFNWWVLRRCDR